MTYSHQHYECFKMFINQKDNTNIWKWSGLESESEYNQIISRISLWLSEYVWSKIHTTQPTTASLSMPIVRTRSINMGLLKMVLVLLVVQFANFANVKWIYLFIYLLITVIPRFYTVLTWRAFPHCGCQAFTQLFMWER